jgi:hypothetical protein
MLKYQTGDGQILTQGNSEDTPVSFVNWNGGLVHIDTKVYTLEEAEKLLDKIRTMIDEGKEATRNQ